VVKRATVQNRSIKNSIALIGLALLTACGVADTARSNIVTPTVIGAVLTTDARPVSTSATTIVALSQVPAEPQSTPVRASPQPTAPRYNSASAVRADTTPTTMPTALITLPYPPPDTPAPGTIIAPDTSGTVDSDALATQVAVIRQRVPLNQDDAVELAIVIARYLGLQQSRPDKFVAREMTLSEWSKLTGAEAKPNTGPAAIDANQRVWVVAMRGKVIYSSPSSAGIEAEEYDNITIILNVATGEYKGLLLAGPGHPLPLSVP
jgi:hypothetical protein